MFGAAEVPAARGDVVAEAAVHHERDVDRQAAHRGRERDAALANAPDDVRVTAVTPPNATPLRRWRRGPRRRARRACGRRPDPSARRRAPARRTVGPGRARRRGSTSRRSARRSRARSGATASDARERRGIEASFCGAPNRPPAAAVTTIRSTVLRRGPACSPSCSSYSTIVSPSAVIAAWNDPRTGSVGSCREPERAGDDLQRAERGAGEPAQPRTAAPPGHGSASAGRSRPRARTPPSRARWRVRGRRCSA